MHALPSTALVLLLSCPVPASARALGAPAGGEAPDEIPPAGRVELLGRLPQAVTSFGACSAGGWVYVLGGHTGRPHDYNAANQSPLFQRLDLADRSTWEVLPSLPRGLQSVILVQADGAVYRFGGMLAGDGSGSEEELSSTPQAARYEPAARAWVELPAMPAGRSSHGAALVGDQAYVVGGWDLAGRMGRASRFHLETWVLDLARPESGWRALATPFARRGLGVASAAGRVIAVGGMDEEGEPSQRLDVLDAATGEWSRGPDLPEDGFGTAAVGLADEFFASGPSGRIWSWRIGTADWIERARLQFPRRFHQLVALDDGSCLALGGTSGGEHVRALERVSLRGGRDLARITGRWTTSAPGRARNRQALALIDDRIYLFGGNSSTGQHDFEPENFLGEGWKLDLRSLAWSPCAALPVQRQSLQTAVPAADSLWVVGGFGHDGERLTTFADAFIYEASSDRWSPAPGLGRGRSQFALLSHAEALWVLGGLDYAAGRASGDFVHPLSILRKDLVSGAEAGFEETGWSLARPRRAFGCALLDGRAYLVGGLADGFEPVEECEVIDLSSGESAPLSSPRRPRISPELVAFAGRLYLAGGASRGDDGQSRPDRSLEVYDPQSGAWSVLVEDLPIEPAHLRLTVHRDRLLAVSTQTDGPASLQLLWIDPR